MIDIKLIKELRDRTALSISECRKALEASNGDIDASIDFLKKWGELKGKEKESRVATEGKIGLFANNSATAAGLFELNSQTDFCAQSAEFNQLMHSFSKTNGFSLEEFEHKRKELVAKTGENIILRRKEAYTTSTDPQNPSILRWYMHQGDKLGVLIEASFPIELSDEIGLIETFVDDCAMQVAAMAPTVVNKEDILPEMISRQQVIFEAQLEEDKKPKQAWPKIIEGKFAKWRKEIVLLEQDSIKDQAKTIGQLLQELNAKLGKTVKINRFVRYALGEGQEKKEENYIEEVSKLIK